MKHTKWLALFIHFIVVPILIIIELIKGAFNGEEEET